MKDCFVYCRSATYDQSEGIGSQILNQINTCKRFTRKEGFRIIRQYIDKGVGSHQPKKQLYEMITACKEEGVSTVITARPDRLSRDIVELFVIKKVLKELNIKIVFASGDEYEQKMLFVCTGFNRGTNTRILNRRAKAIMSGLRQE